MSKTLGQLRLRAQASERLDAAQLSNGGSAGEGSVARVCVLLATHNGGRWIDEQLKTIKDQRDVLVSVVVSDDASRDATLDRLGFWQSVLPLRLLPTAGHPLGSANRNFLRLIRDADPGDAEYVALADQDDVWLSDKLSRAVDRLQSFEADAYSSDVIAFWPSGRRRKIVKSNAQRAYDHLFESPGAGCTFVFPRRSYDELRAWVSLRFEHLQEVKVHDWLIYAYARNKGWRWHIDDYAGMLYRQHAGNEIGANSGWSAAFSRISQIYDGRYRVHVLEIAEAVGLDSAEVRAIRQLRLRDRVWLFFHACQCRRRFSEQAVFAMAALIMPRSADGS